MATRSAFSDDSYSLSSNDGSFVEEVDLTVMPWNRTTVADGQWLNDRAIAPLSARDVYLADCIDSVISSVNTLAGKVNRLDTMSGESRRAGSLTTVDKAAEFSIGASNYDTLRSTESDHFIPNDSFISYSVSNSTQFNPDISNTNWSKDGCILQHNVSDKAFQIFMNNSGNFAFRTLTGTNFNEYQTTVSSEDGSLEVIHYQSTNNVKWQNIISIKPDMPDGLYGIQYSSATNTYVLTAVEAGGAAGFIASSGLSAEGKTIGIRVNDNSNFAFNSSSALQIKLNPNGNITELSDGSLSAKDTTYSFNTSVFSADSNNNVNVKINGPTQNGLYMLKCTDGTSTNLMWDAFALQVDNTYFTGNGNYTDEQLGLKVDAIVAADKSFKPQAAAGYDPNEFWPPEVVESGTSISAALDYIAIQILALKQQIESA